MGYPQHRQPGTLTPFEVATQWEAVPLRDFKPEALYAAVKRRFPEIVAPDAAGGDTLSMETVRQRCMKMFDDNRLSLIGCRWPDQLRGVAAWVEDVDQPPEAALQEAYRVAVQALPSLPRRIAERDFDEGTKPGGTA